MFGDPKTGNSHCDVSKQYFDNHVSVGGVSGAIFVKAFKLFKYLIIFRSKYRFGKLRASRINENYNKNCIPNT